MKTLTLLLGAAWLGLWQANSQPAKPPFTIQITATSPTVKAGSTVGIGVVLSNTSTQPVDCSGSISGLTHQDPYLTFEVRDDRGRLVPKRVYPHPELTTGHPINCTVGPGETRSEYQELDRIYDMTRPGVYTVRVSRPISATDEKPGVVKSNKITITITP